LTFSHIGDPLAATLAIASLSKELEELGFKVSTSSNISDLVACRVNRRGSQITPFFDPEVSGLGTDRFFWMKLTGGKTAIAGIQAFRCDVVSTSLSDWAPAYHIGLYMRRKELCVPTFATPPSSSKTQDVKGRLVYHGELWLDQHIKNRKVLNLFTRLGMILSYLKWNADAIWALASQQMASHGHAHRMGYSHVESGFLKWDWAPEGNPLAEYLLLSERLGIEHVIAETNNHASEATAGFQESAKVLPFKLSEYLQEKVL
jgi:hypothetical protein